MEYEDEVNCTLSDINTILIRSLMLTPYPSNEVCIIHVHACIKCKTCGLQKHNFHFKLLSFLSCMMLIVTVLECFYSRKLQKMAIDIDLIM